MKRVFLDTNILIDFALGRDTGTMQSNYYNGDLMEL